MTTDTKVEIVRIDNFVRFSSLYSEVYTRLKGREPYAMTIRRAFNRFNKAAKIDNVTNYRADNLVSAFEQELTA